MKTALLFIVIFARTMVFGADINYPKTLAELDDWYVQPLAGQNAASNYLAAFAVLKVTDTDTTSTNLPLIGEGKLPLPDEPIPPSMKTAIGEFIQRNHSALILLYEASKLDQSRYPINLKRGQFTLLPHLPKIKLTAQVLKLSAASNALAGRGGRAGNDVLSVLSLAQSLESEPVLISQLVRMACLHFAVNGLEQVLNRVALSDETLSQLSITIGKLEGKESVGFGFTRAFVGERLTGLVNFNTTPGELLKVGDGFTSEVRADADSESQKFQDMVLAQVSALKQKPKSEIQRIIEADRQLFENTFDQVAMARTNPFPARFAQNEIFRSAAATAINQNFILSSMFLPSLEKASFREARALAYLRLAWTAVALEGFSAATNRYPETLDELTPNFLVSVSKGPFDGHHLRYRKTDNGYVLYSIGDNLKDDLGTRAKLPDGDLVFAVEKPSKR